MKFEGDLSDLVSATPYVRGFDNGHWKFPEQMGNTEAGVSYVGFIYVIRDNYLRRLYLGKKLFYGMGQLNRGKESDWRKYCSSSPVLKEMFKHRPKSEFEFVCLEEYRTKGTLSYSETWSLCYVEAPTNDTFYNRLIEKVSWPVKERITERHKNRLHMCINWESLDG